VKGNRFSDSNTKSSRKTSSFSNYLLIGLIVLLSAVIIFLSYSLYMKIRVIADNKDKNDRDKVSAIIQVEVLNGCGVDGIASQFTNFLRDKNFDVVSIGNFKSDNMEETIIIDRTGNRVNAEKLADVLGVSKKNIIEQLNKDYFLDATLVIGKDYNRLEPLN
jgi:hypothetical protein